MANHHLNKIETELFEMYHSITPFLEEYPWEMEEDRWAELVVCLFSGIVIDTKVARKAVDLLKGLGMLAARDLAMMDDDQMIFVNRVLIQSGIEAVDAEKATLCLLKFSRLVSSKWEGYIQQFLRSHGERMVKELQTYLLRSGIETEQSKKIAAVWLQNVCNIPILLPGDPHVLNFCSRHKITENELIDILDNLGLNVCVADDLLAVKYNLKASENNTKTSNAKSKVTKKKRLQK